MNTTPMIETIGLTKRYGRVPAVDGLSFQVRPGRVTGFLGPNGAGKTTTLRLILGLDTPTAGTALVDGLPYRRLARPLRTVGSLLDAGAAHPGRRARDHLAWLAAANDLAAGRVGEVLERVGLANVADRRVGGFSLGMRQRLGLAAALLGDPRVLILDEPVNGLDAEGVRWMRTLLRSLAAEGRTILISSHLMSETAQTADHLIVIGRGRLLADTGVRDLVETGAVLVRTTDPAALADALSRAGATVTPEPGGALAVVGLPPEAVSRVAAARGLTITELTTRQASLEDAYLALTSRSLDYETTTRPAR